jgi:SAM-dependent methyltransferase
MLPDRYFIKHGYVARLHPEYDDKAAPDSAVWQESVYEEAVSVARSLGARRLIDVGCGNGDKLAKFGAQFETIGIDFGPNIIQCRSQYPSRRWMEHDIEAVSPLPLAPTDLSGAVVISADVIEHLIRPELLLRKLKTALELVSAVVISTPERDLTWGVNNPGPPPNKGHVREWAIGEFASFLASEGFHDGTLRLARSNDQEPSLNTILAVLLPSSRT